MLIDAAKARVRLKCQAAAEPTLSDQEISDLLTGYALVDANGLGPGETGWVGTWELQEVYRQGWLLKAAKVAPEVTFQVDGAQYSQSDIFEHCMAMADKFGAIGTISVSTV